MPQTRMPIVRDQGPSLPERSQSKVAQIVMQIEHAVGVAAKWAGCRIKSSTSPHLSHSLVSDAPVQINALGRDAACEGLESAALEREQSEMAKYYAD